jgi:hypothetical protein
MHTREESRSFASAASEQPSQKLRQLLRKRLRQLLRVSLVSVICLTIGAGVLAIRWLTCLNGLPDIGDPFHESATRNLKIADDRNALHFLLRAQAKLIPLPEFPQGVRSAVQTVAWSQADPKLRKWVSANLPALELFQQGADRADGIWQPAGQYYWQNYPMMGDNGLMSVALLEGSRRGESGDMAGAWDCYRAVLRMTTHLRRRGQLDWRATANVVHAALRERLLTWATDPKTTIPQIRRALDEALESQPRPEWDVATLRFEYLDLMRYLEAQVHPSTVQIEEDLTFRFGDLQLRTDLALYIYELKRLLAREPERSRRVIRLIFANWLARAQNPDPRQWKPILRARFHVSGRTGNVLFYSTSPESPANARLLSPREVSTWLFTTNDAKLVLERPILEGVRMTEQRGYRELVLLLAGELYYRERGTHAASDETLVGTYLTSLPDDGTVDLDDGTIGTVSEQDDSTQASLD